MKSKIDEIMGLVDAFANACEHEIMADMHGEVPHVSAQRTREAIEQKLRELLREPLDAHEVGCLIESAAYLSTETMMRADFINGIRYAERAHSITKESEVK